MLISQVINELLSIQDKYGDVEVRMEIWGSNQTAEIKVEMVGNKVVIKEV